MRSSRQKKNGGPFWGPASCRVGGRRPAGDHTVGENVTPEKRPLLPRTGLWTFVPLLSIGLWSRFDPHKLRAFIHLMSGRSSLLRVGRSAVVLPILLMIGACAAVVSNAPLPPSALNDQSGPISKGGYRLTALPQKETGSDLLVLLSFSGGGKRSAAFAYGVLEGLRDFSLPAYGPNAKLLDAVDVIAAVSGGSFPAAYYGLYRDRIFADFDKDFLSQNIDNYIWGSFLLPWHYRWLFDGGYGTNDR